MDKTIEELQAENELLSARVVELSGLIPLHQAVKEWRAGLISANLVMFIFNGTKESYAQTYEHSGSQCA